MRAKELREKMIERNAGSPHVPEPTKPPEQLTSQQYRRRMIDRAAGLAEPSATAAEARQRMIRRATGQPEPSATSAEARARMAERLAGHPYHTDRADSYPATPEWREDAAKPSRATSLMRKQTARGMPRAPGAKPEQRVEQSRRDRRHNIEQFLESKA